MAQEISRRQMLKLGAGASAAALLAACGINRGAETTVTSTSIAGSTSSTASRATKELSLWIVDHNPAAQSVLEGQIIPAFQDANPGYRVNLRLTGWERFAEEVTTAFTGGVGPDIYQGGAVWVGQQVDRGWALPLSSYVDQAPAEWNWNDFVKGAQEDATVEGEIYAIPYRVAPRALWYRSDHLEEAGFASPPSTFEDLREIANAAVRREGGQITREGFDTNLGGGPDWQAEMQTFWDFMHPAGGRFLNEDLTRCTLDEDPAVEALEFLTSLVLEDQVMPYPSFENQGELSALELGLATMGFSVEIPDIRARQYAPEQVEFVHAALPLTRESQASHLYVYKYFIGSQTQDPEGSWLLLQHLTASENLEAYSAAAGYLTPRSSLAEADYLSENLKVVARAGAYGVPYPRHPNLLELFRPFSENLDRCFRGQLSPLETMQETVNAINALL
jgi:multiple sugar transport system substrate-binding protein